MKKENSIAIIWQKNKFQKSSFLSINEALF